MVRSYLRNAMVLMTICCLVIRVSAQPKETTQEQIPFYFGIPINLGSMVDSSSHDCTPFISGDDLTLFFASDRPGGFGSF